MDPGGRQAALDPSGSDDLAQFIRAFEGRQHQAGLAHFNRPVCIRTRRSGQVMLAGIVEGLLIKTGLHAAGIEHLDSIHLTG